MSCNYKAVVPIAVVTQFTIQDRLVPAKHPEDPIPWSNSCYPTQGHSSSDNEVQFTCSIVPAQFGRSSWGPTILAFRDDATNAHDAARRLQNFIGAKAVSKAYGESGLSRSSCCMPKHLVSCCEFTTLVENICELSNFYSCKQGIAYLRLTERTCTWLLTTITAFMND